MKITKEDAKVILAFHDGKDIQFYSDITVGWRDVMGVPTWDFDESKYRVKPEPKDIWVNEYDRDKWYYEDKHQAIRDARQDATRVAVHYREVIEG